MADKRRASGRAFEYWVRDFLRARGWAVHLAGRRAAYIHGKIITKGDDIFGADLVAMKPGEPVLFVQASLDGGIAKRAEEVKRWAWPEAAAFELWIKTGPGAVNVKAWEPAAGEFRDRAKIIRGTLFEKAREASE